MTTLVSVAVLPWCFWSLVGFLSCALPQLACPTSWKEAA